MPVQCLVVLKACVPKAFVFYYTVVILHGSLLLGSACQLFAFINKALLLLLLLLLLSLRTSDAFRLNLRDWFQGFV